MKRAITFFLILISLLQLTGCSSQILEQTEIYSKIRIARLSDQASVTIGIETARLPELLAQLSGSFKGEGSCEGNHEHKYLISLLRENMVTMALYMDDNGIICKDGKKFSSDSKSENPIQVSYWDDAFAEAALYTIPEEETKAVQDDEQLEIVVKSPPKRVSGTENAKDKTLCATAGEWSYYIGTMPFEGAVTTMLWRENAGGEAQRLCNISQPADEKKHHKLLYVERSFETTNGKYLFFSIKNEYTKHYTLWLYNIERGILGEYLSNPCSNMIITEVSVADKEKLGWIVQGQNLFAINMESGTIIYELSMTLQNVVPESLFYNPDAKDIIKEVKLSDLGSGNVSIDIISRNKQTDAIIKTEGYIINFITYRITKK